MKKNFTKRLTLLVFLLGMVGSVLAQGGTQNLPLVAETDFSCSGKDPGASFAAIEEVDGFGKSYFTPTLSTPLNVVTSTKSTETESDFLSKFQYAVTPNPVRLDAYRFYDNGDNGEWGFVVSGGNNASFQKMLSFEVTGVKNGGKYRVEVDICNPFDSTKIPAGYVAQIRMGVNNTSTSKGQDLAQISSKIMKGGWVTASVSGPTQTQEMMAITNNRLTVNLIIGQLPSNQAIMVKGIRVYAEVEPTISGLNEACANGKSIKLTANNIGQNSTIEWYRNGMKISGATGQTFTHIPGEEAGTFKYSCRVNMPNGYKATSRDHTINDIICCTDETGKAISRRLIWQEDFGTFTSDSTYWTWDYSNLNAPKKVTHNDGEKWTTCYGLNIPGAECDKSPSEEGKYTVAGNVTCEYSGATEGTQWGWEAICFNGKYPHENNYPFVPDHTYQGSDFGGMLFLNCGNEANEVIYSKKITGSILKDQNVTAKCFVNTFSNAENPVKIFIQLTDLESGAVVKSTTVTRNSINEGLEWKQAVVSSLIEGDSILIEVVSVGGGEEYNRYGNDLILDDIQLFVCDDSEGSETTSILANYAPTIEGDTLRCSYETSVYRLSEKAPEGCEYYWSKDRGPFVKGGDSCIVKTAENDAASTHRLTCRIISPDEGEVTVSIDYEVIGVGLSLKVESYPEDIFQKRFTAIAESPKHVQRYYWFLNGKSLSIADFNPGAGPITFEFGEDGGLVEVYTISDHGCKSDTVSSVIDSYPICVDGDGNKTPQTLLWQEDFGTFTSDSTYWTWDYSNLDAPKKVTHKDASMWTTCYGLEIPGTECDVAPSIEGKFTVAGNVTCSYEGVAGGTLWGWEAICFNGKYPRENGYTFVPDHTYQGSDFGGMLFINGGNSADDVIYSKQIKSTRLKGKNVTARCFVNTFSDAPTPVEVYIRVTDAKTGTAVTSNKVTRNTTTDGLAWFVANVSTIIEGDEVLIEVVNAIGGQEANRFGNDLILDDIQLFVCEGGSDSPVCTPSAEPIIYADGKNVRTFNLNAGKTLTLTSNNVTTTDINGETYTDFTMSWHKDNATSKALKTNKGVVADSLVVKWDDVDTNGTMFILVVQDNFENTGDEKTDICTRHDTITVYAVNSSELELYCEDGNGKLIPQKLVWQEDFGTFTSDSTYWTWDYSDLDAPKKVMHEDGKIWTSCFDLDIPGTVCDTAPSLEGKYTVAGNVTCSYDGVQGGTQWGWAAMCFNGKYPRENGYTFVPDHTYQGSDFGGMLFLNGGNEAGDVIYARQISNSKLKNKNASVRCFVNTFSNATNPVKVFIRLTDLSSGATVTSDAVTRSTTTAGLAWYEASVSTFLDGDEVLIEIINAVGGDEYNKNGNDLILDDIRLYICDDSEHVGVETQSAEEMDELVNVYTVTGIILKSNVKRSEALDGLKKGTYYIVGHEKVLVDL